MPLRKPILLLLAGSLVLACARQPVLFPNDQLEHAGRDAAEARIAECERQASEFIEAGGSRAVGTAADTAVGAGAGAAAGAVGGAIRGGAGIGAAIGAASGATYSFIRSIFRRRDPDPVHKRLVERCLEESGYEVAGWR